MNWILTLLILASASIMAVVVLRKLPQIRVIDVASIPKEHERRVKEQIILSKLQRTGGAKLQGVARMVGEAVKIISRYGRRAVQRLYRLEQSYQRLRRTASEGTHSYNEERIKQRLEEAQKLIDQDEFIPAEKIFIDVISHNPKSVDAYEALGNMYIESGQFDQARETLQFTLRISPNDASVHVSLAELEMKQGHPKQALTFLRKAVEKRPKNPRYLDFYIHAALETGSLKDARKGILALKDVNPENQKIEEFERRFQEKKDAYIQKTTSGTEKPVGESSQEG
ncbi:tetratricopeptide repeat protein [Candidatus Uhrbacteria bacterium]|nr:tetratricopeptide repeat protein [Candidatus Uhrbacteria bacterium]